MLYRRVHCTHCHPDGGDIERDRFDAHLLVRAEADGSDERYPHCPDCGQEMTGRNLWCNGHSADGWEPV